MWSGGRYGLLRLRFNDDVKAPSSIFPVAWSKIQPRCFLKCQWDDNFGDVLELVRWFVRNTITRCKHITVTYVVFWMPRSYGRTPGVVGCFCTMYHSHVVSSPLLFWRWGVEITNTNFHQLPYKVKVWTTRGNTTCCYCYQYTWYL